MIRVAIGLEGGLVQDVKLCKTKKEVSVFEKNFYRIRGYDSEVEEERDRASSDRDIYVDCWEFKGKRLIGDATGVDAES